MFYIGSKRQRNLVDDDFEDEMATASGQQMIEGNMAITVGEHTRNKKENNLYFRRSPSEFVKYIQILNPRQIKAVNELGFGAILNYKIPYIHGLLAHWILYVFNRPRSRIEYSTDESLRLTEEDVHLTFGFPKGPTLIERGKSQNNFAYNDAVAARCGKSRYMCTATEIGDLMLQDVDGGPDFKKLFMFLMENALIETPGDGMIKPKILHFIDNVDEIRNMNWCGYLISVLDYTYARWVPGTSVSFTGPISFLVCAYADRVVHCPRTVSRAWPTIKGWTTEAFKKREDKELELQKFGTGSLEGPIDKEKYLIEEERRLQAMNVGDREDADRHRAKRIKDS